MGKVIQTVSQKEFFKKRRRAGRHSASGSVRLWVQFSITEEKKKEEERAKEKHSPECLDNGAIHRSEKTHFMSVAQ
jgi:hypothetical protein